MEKHRKIISERFFFRKGGSHVSLVGALCCRCLGDDVFEQALLPGIGRMVHHGDDGVVVLLVLVVEEHQLGPEVGLLRCPENLRHTHTQRHTLAGLCSGSLISIRTVTVF